jgi:hypothetical protein
MERLDCSDIQLALFFEHDKGQNIIAFNTTKVLRHEADVVLLRPTGVTVEFEVKVSRADFLADFRKVIKHQQLKLGIEGGPQHFYYACEPGVIPIEKVPSYAGLVHVSRKENRRRGSQYEVEVVKKAPRLHKTPNHDIHLRLCRSLMYKALRNAQ